MKTKRRITMLAIFCMTLTTAFAQNPDLFRTWYISQVINDLEPNPFTQPPTISDPASITFTDTGSGILVTGFSGCNNFQITADSFSDFGTDAGDFVFSNFSSDTNYCSDAYTGWQNRFYWMLDGHVTYFLHETNGVSYLDIEHPLLSGIYLQSQPLTIEETSIATVRIYPNPTTDKLFISNSSLQIQSFIIHNIQGQKLKEIKNTNNYIDVSSLSKGLYFLEINTTKGKFTEKFLKS